MTKTTEKASKPKQVPLFYIFANGENGQSGNRVGAAFAHGKGKGMTILIDGKRFAAFPPKAQTQEASAEGKAA